MKILVLDNDLKERKLIQHVALEGRHEIVAAENSAAAMRLLQEGDIRFVIADRLSTDIEDKQFIQRIRDAQPPYYIYILLLTAKVQNSDFTIPRTAADDFLHKPFLPIELKLRLQLGERILKMGDHLKQARHTLTNTALFDSLPNILNYKAFLILSRGELERARREQSPLSLIALEIDNLRSIHDRFGEAVSNDVLTVAAQGIREKSRPYDGVGRYEGSTFLIILPGVIGQDAEKIAERILTGILSTDISLWNGTKVNLSLSAGIACSIHITAATEVEFLIEKALEAVKQARRDPAIQAVTVFV